MSLSAGGGAAVRRIYAVLAPRAYSVLIFCALSCTLAAKLLQAVRDGKLGDYFYWILSDVSCLLFVELVLVLMCYYWRRRVVFRLATVVAAVVCTWSVIHAGYLIRMGTQVMPRVLLPMVRDPVNGFRMIGGNLVKMPLASVLLLGPSLLVLAFFVSVLVRPPLRTYNRRRFTIRVAVCLAVALCATLARPFAGSGATSAFAKSPHVRAAVSLFRPPLEESHRELPFFDQVRLASRAERLSHNVIVVVLEGVQYAYTSLADGNDATPFLASIAREGIEFRNTRSTVTHTTKALFALLTGRYPSASEDLAEAVPASRPYASLATILARQRGYRTAFFQSAQGDFESRPGLISNLGFDKFWARDDLGDPNHYIYYLGCDEFALLEPMTEWIRRGEAPFLLVMLCSVTHDPYDVPRWYAERAEEPIERYKQTIAYTDKFLQAFDAELAGLNLRDRTILAVVGDHGEAFGEHGRSGHDQIAFDEVLRVPFCIRVPFGAGGRRIDEPASSVDVTPTLLGLLGFETAGAGFDGLDLLGPIPKSRRVYFSGWVRDGPSGYVVDHKKFVYHPDAEVAYWYDLARDPKELSERPLSAVAAQQVTRSVLTWRADTVFRLEHEGPGRQRIYGRWLLWWKNRLFIRARYLAGDGDRE